MPLSFWQINQLNITNNCRISGCKKGIKMKFYNLPQSTYIKKFSWIGERLPYPEKDIRGDTYPMTWADDDEIYTSAGDPLWGETINGLDVEKFSGGPEDYKITKYNDMNDYLGWGGKGPKPSGMICVDGVLYLAFQNLLPGNETPYSAKSQSGADASIVRSVPRWNQWYPSFAARKEPMFPGTSFGGPSFINFGKNNANARDNFVYAVSGDQWDNGSNVRLGRVPKDKIMEKFYWEFVCTFEPDGTPVWNRDLTKSIPILAIHRYIGLPEMVYLSEIKRYLFLTWHLKDDFNPDAGTDLLILEAPEPWGPFSLVYFEELWEGKACNPYCPRVPLKWMSADQKTGYIQFSGSWSNGPQPDGMWKQVEDENGLTYYRSNLRKFQLELF